MWIVVLIFLRLEGENFMRELSENELRSVEGGYDYWADTWDDFKDVVQGACAAATGGLIGAAYTGNIALVGTAALTGAMVEAYNELQEDLGNAPQD
ncbi:MAG: bacteriocin [Candidatus Mcinerneyibacterium aminivorans]|jgi:bacteriocin-like protein|uniref:Bacteriocin n=1 Tax=Candidatus Mcinerneyibacterium aminivorans TaxID=2703815 RepID=A0A5D0MF87_9BACT|nr:MAG: bacteriocin [Candidatus Mcinerneyibacterium aminivorans]